MTKQVSVLGNLRVAGAMVMDKDEVDFPLNPKPGTLLMKGGSLFAYTTINNVLTWFPLFRNSSNAYVHTQTNPSTQWVVNHQLGSEYCWYQLKDTAGNLLYENSAVLSNGNNTTTFTFTEPVSGTAIFVAPNDIVLSNINASLLNVGVVEITTTSVKINGDNVLTASLVAETVTPIVDAAITTLKGGVDASADSLAKLHGMIQAIQTTLQSDDVTLDTVQELVNNIKADNNLLALLTNGAENINALGSVSGAKNIGYGSGSYVTMTVTAATTLTISGIPDATHAYAVTLEITNGGTNVAWPAGVTWLGAGTAPALKASGVNLVTLVTRNGGSTWFGNSA